jgi:hypothetical protein
LAFLDDCFSHEPSLPSFDGRRLTVGANVTPRPDEFNEPERLGAWLSAA